MAEASDYTELYLLFPFEYLNDTWYNHFVDRRRGCKSTHWTRRFVGIHRRPSRHFKDKRGIHPVYAESGTSRQADPQTSGQL